MGLPEVLNLYSSHLLLGVIVSFGLWFVYFILKSAYVFYIWQVKEYRWDRLKAEIKKNKRIIFPITSFLSAYIFCLIFLPPYVAKILKTNKPDLPLFLVGTTYLYGIYLFVYLSFYLNSLYRKLTRQERAFLKIKLPRFTKKMTVLFFSFIFFLLLAGIFLTFKNRLLLVYSLILADIFAFFLVSFWVTLFKIPNYFLKKHKFNLAREKRESFKGLTVIGIAGSYGKTSTKEFLATLLEKKFGKEKVLKSAENQNTEIALAELVLNKLSKNHQFLITEIGAYKIGEIKKAMGFLKPQIGILTGISFQHLELFGSEENIKKAKSEIVSNLPKEGLAIFNGTNQEVYEIAKNYTRAKKIIYSLNYKPEVDIWAEDIKLNEESLEFKINSKIGSEKIINSETIKLNLIGKQHIENFLGAVSAAINLGLNLKEIKEFAKELVPPPTSMKKVKAIYALRVIEDSYNLNFEGVLAALDYLKIYKEGRKIIIIPCLIELGKLFEKVHEKLAEEISQTCDLVLITDKNCLKIFKKQAPNRIKFAPTLEEAIKILESKKLKEKDVILLEGRIRFKNALIEYLKDVDRLIRLK